MESFLIIVISGVFVMFMTIFGFVIRALFVSLRDVSMSLRDVRQSIHKLNNVVSKVFVFLIMGDRLSEKERETFINDLKENDGN